jgi:hypothetical protein
MDNREADNNPHPPSCTCVDCENARLKRLRKEVHPSYISTCPRCGKKSLWLNGKEKIYECLNLECKARGVSLDDINKVKKDYSKYMSPEETYKMADKYKPSETTNRPPEAYRNVKLDSRKRKSNYSALIWIFSVILIFLAIGGIAKFFINSSEPAPATIVPINSQSPKLTVSVTPVNSPTPLISIPPSPQLEEPSYNTFLDSKLNMSLDYPNPWSISAPFYPLSDEVQITIKEPNSKVSILVDYKRNAPNNTVYQTAFETAYHLISLNSNSSKGYSYSQFSKYQGDLQSDVFLYNLPSSIFVLTFNYPVDSPPIKIGLLNRIAMHMINSINNSETPSTSNTSVIIPNLSSTTSPIRPATMTTFPTSIGSTTGYNTKTPTYTSTLSSSLATPRSTAINSSTGKYNNFYLGLFHSSEGVMAGNGCYDDTGNFIVLVNNQNAKDPTYSQLVTFLNQSKVDQYPYQYINITGGSYRGTAESHVNLKRIQNIIDVTMQPSNPKMCGDFAERLHNEAEKAGIRSGFVSLDLSGVYDYYHYGIPSDSGHACNVFQTTDRGIIYVDVTNSPGPKRSVATVNIKLNQQYVPTSLFPELGWSSTYSSMGTVTNMELTWDGSWKN